MARLWAMMDSSDDGQAPSPRDARLYAPAALRNREPIAAVLETRLPARGRVLEVASGTGEHAAFFAARWPALTWQPSDPDPERRASIDAHAHAAALNNLAPALALDTTAPVAAWPLESADAVVCINLTHIAPWAASEGLLAGAAHCLPAGGVLAIYGPFRREGVHTAESNARFDALLRQGDPGHGVRDTADIARVGAAHGLRLDEVVAMPANNFTLILRRTA